jgi:hypothetical protein
MLLLNTRTALLLLSTLATVAHGDLNSSLLAYLNNITVSAINPALASGIPDPVVITTVQKTGSADAGCIIPNPITGGCICHADAEYSISLDNVAGLSKLHVTNWTHVAATAPAATINLTVVGEMAVTAVVTSGSAHASVTACGISPSASGDASTTIDTQATLTLLGAAVFNATASCFDIIVSGATVALHDFKDYGNHVDISLGIIKLDVGKLLDLLEELVPDIVTALENALQAPLSQVLKTVIGAQLPCVPLGPTLRSGAVVGLGKGGREES